jgi:MFS family permease
MTEPRPAEPGAVGSALPVSRILALLVAQLGVHASMAGVRMAAPLQVLQEGGSTLAVGLLLALFAVAPVALAMKAGRMADRHGLRKPMRVAVALAVSGAALAVSSTQLSGASHVAALSIAALLSGAGANFGVLAIQRAAGLAARDATERVRLFSWLGIAPSLANVLGPVCVGLAIDLSGFAAAYALMLLLPLASIRAVRSMPDAPGSAPPAAAAEGWSALSLLRVPGFKRLLVVNWLLAMCWDVHGFALPVLGHGLGFSASTIGLLLGTFTASVSLVRLVIPAVAHRVSEARTLQACMLGTAVVFAAYPLVGSPWTMALLAALLGVTLGSAQPMIMSTLHHLTPDGRHGESLAFRSMAINLSSAVMPLVFGVLGVATGAGVLFWIVGGAVAAGAGAARRLGSR